MGSCCSPPSAPLCSQEHSGVGDGHAAGVRLISLPGSPPPPAHPFLSSLRHLSPPSVFVSKPLSVSVFSPLTTSSPFFHSFLSSVCLPISTSLSSLSLCFWWIAAPPLSLASGPSHSICMPAILCMLSHDTTETEIIYIQSLFLFTACSLCHAPWHCLLITFSLSLWWSSLAL